MIKAVLFDAGGVLHYTNEGAQYNDLTKTLGLTDEQMAIFYREIVPLHGKGLLTEEQVWQQMSARFGIRHVEPSEHLLTRAWEPLVEKIPGMYELIDELKDRGLQTVLVTNITPPYADVLRAKGHYDPFDITVLSYEVGSWKPEDAIFLKALELAGVQPEEAVMVDDLAWNIEAVNRLGVHGILFKDPEQLRAELEPLLNQ